MRAEKRKNSEFEKQKITDRQDLAPLSQIWMHYKDAVIILSGLVDR